MKKKYLFLTVVVVSSIGAEAFTEENTEKIFTEIYETGAWGYNEKGEGFSGSGSTVKNTKFYIKFLEDFMKMNQIQSVLDVGCGDWTFSQYINWNNIDYTGTDIVKSVIDEDNKKFGSETVKFLWADALQIDLPPADLLICKDVLMHLTNSDIVLFMKKIEKFKHCLFIHNVEKDSLSSENAEILRGGFRPIDLTKTPFNFDGVKILNYETDHAIKQIVYLKGGV